MKKFAVYFTLSLIVIVVAFFLVSLIMSNIHDVTMIAEWRDWLEKMNIIKETAEPAVETTKAKILSIGSFLNVA